MIRRIAAAEDTSRNCTNCLHFTSYRDAFFGNEHEPESCGNCSVNRDTDGTSFASDWCTCEKFKPLGSDATAQS